MTIPKDCNMQPLAPVPKCRRCQMEMNGVLGELCGYCEADLRNRVRRQPRTVCICGSSRFCDIAAVKAWEFEKQGILALGMHLLPQWYCDRQKHKADAGGRIHHLAEQENVAQVLDALHLRKIEMADFIYVVNEGGYIGCRTAIEIDHAMKLGKPVEYMEKV